MWTGAKLTVCVSDALDNDGKRKSNTQAPERNAPMVDSGCLWSCDECDDEGTVTIAWPQALVESSAVGWSSGIRIRPGWRTLFRLCVLRPALSAPDVAACPA